MKNSLFSLPYIQLSKSTYVISSKYTNVYTIGVWNVSIELLKMFT